MSGLADPLRLGPATARNRIFFGPHETNLGRRRGLSERHVAYYRARAAGGAGVIVVEEAAVHASDWPYERSPSAEEAPEGWAAVASACRSEGALVIGALGHSGGQGSSAYHQRALWGPSAVPDVVTREVPKAMEPEDVSELVASFADAAAAASKAGLDGVEVNAGQWSLLRQFLSRLTNRRADRYGSEPPLLLREVLAAVRGATPPSVVGLRFSCDEMAPWAGIVPEEAVGTLASLAGEDLFDYVTVVRGSAYGTGATRPDGNVAVSFNAAAAEAVRRALPSDVAVVLQGSVVDPADARALLQAGCADAVEVTRGQIADARFAAKSLSGDDASIRPCVLCNQCCQVRDVRNPVVSCIGEPRSGHELDESPPPPRRGRRGHVIVVGAGPAGLECARVAALGGLRVTILERSASLGGMVRAAARLPGHARFELLAEHLEAECRRAGVEVETGREATLELLESHEGPIVLATGSREGRRSFAVAARARVLLPDDVLASERSPFDPSPPSCAVWDPVGGPVGVGVAELLAALCARVTLITPDVVAGAQLGRTGDLAPANVRLARLGVSVVRHARLVEAAMDEVVVEDRFSSRRESIAAAAVVDAGHRLGEDSLFRGLAATGRTAVLVGDALAPRTVQEAVIEGRRAAADLLAEAV